jgi:chromate transporter
MPGPLFTFAAYLGAASKFEPNGWLGGLLALMAIFLPAFLLIYGTLPFWDEFRTRRAFQAALRGVNAAVVGLLLAALYNPVWTSAILTSKDFGLALADFGLLVLWKWPPWLVVVFSGVAAALLALW